MTVQRDRMREILVELRARGVFVVIGGPWITRGREDWFPEGTAVDVDLHRRGRGRPGPSSLEDWEHAASTRRKLRAGREDRHGDRVPPPRYDLDPQHREYAMGCVQTSRGCPFQCEFCDIIVIFNGRRPRVKTHPSRSCPRRSTPSGELGVHAVSSSWSTTTSSATRSSPKEILRALIDWQHATRLPAGLRHLLRRRSTWPRTTRLLQFDGRRAGLVAVFIEIESPDEEAAQKPRSIPNVRGSLIDPRSQRRQSFGLEVYCWG